MSNDRPFFSVLIPSLGRESIYNVIRQIEGDSKTFNNIEILIMAHGEHALRNIALIKTNLQIKVILVDKKLALSDVCNEGLIRAKGEFICWFSDDDDWLEGKFLKLFENIKLHPGYDVYIGQSKVRNRIRPTVGIQEPETIFSYLYGKKVLLGHYNFLGLVNSAVKNRKNIPRFRKNISVFEDILWLSDLKNSGNRFFQIYEVFSKFNPLYERSNQRQDIDSIKSLYNEIYLENPSTANSFLIYHASRASIASGTLGRYIEISKLWFHGRNFAQYFYVFILQYILTFSIKFLKKSRISPI
jgi:hypothetical protein